MSQVSWLRYTGARTIPDLLTVGNTTYTRDTHISSSFSYPNNWGLRMQDVERKDSGLYICQISTHPPLGLLTTVRVTGTDLACTSLD